MNNPKRPRDINQLASQIVSLSTGQTQDAPEPTLTPEQHYAREFARKGGLVGGKARAAKLSDEQRKAIAKKGAAARWQLKGDKKH